MPPPPRYVKASPRGGSGGLGGLGPSHGAVEFGEALFRQLTEPPQFECEFLRRRISEGVVHGVPDDVAGILVLGREAVHEVAAELRAYLDEGVDRLAIPLPCQVENSQSR